jgi:hypothetical protein
MEGHDRPGHPNWTFHSMNNLAYSYHYAIDNIIYKSCLDDIVFVADSDVFLMEEIDLVAFMKNKDIGGINQLRGDFDYLWPAFLMLNMPKIRKFEPRICFDSCNAGAGAMTDFGGATHSFIHDNNITPHYLSCDWGGEYRGHTLINMETFMGGKFLHLRGGSLWDGKADVFEKKLKILNNIILDDGGYSIEEE